MAPVGTHVVERDRPYHHGHIVETCPGDGDYKVEWDDEPLHCGWVLAEGLIMVTGS